MRSLRFGPDNTAATYVPDAFAEQTIDTGEAVINYATVGAPEKPALLLIPGQAESWWGYEQAMAFFDAPGQGGRSACTPASA